MTLRELIQELNSLPKSLLDTEVFVLGEFDTPVPIALVDYQSDYVGIVGAEV